MRTRHLILALVLAGPFLALAAPAQPAPTGLGPSGTSLQVRVGWGGYVVPDRWNPVYVTLSDPKPRNVLLEFRAPHGSFHGMLSKQQMTIGPQPQTFVVYMPLRHYMPGDLSFVVRDAATRRRLADYPGGAFVSFSGGAHVSPGFSFIGVSGRRATLRPVVALPGAKIQAGHIDPSDLPTSPVGYDCLDVLALNAADLNAISREQQLAVVEWVRAGGNLLLWPGDDPVPDSGPLVDVLPARIGSSGLVRLSPEELKAAGLTARFASIPSRDLVPAGGADPLRLLAGGRATAFQKRVGLGRAVVSPIDLAALQFNDSQATWALWRAVLKPMIRRLPEDATEPAKQTHYGAAASEAQLRQSTALRQVGDMLGNVPGAGRFGFGYVAGILIAMMVVVGPVDWLLLKKLGRQPWTWATTTGWVALVTLSAVYAGHLFKSGELHWRTFELVDQSDGVTAARTTLSALYSPRTAEYTVQTEPDGWWQPASPGDEFYGYRRSAQEIAFTQTYRGSTPQPMVVNVWNLRFLKGETTQPRPAVVEADLKVETEQVRSRPRRRLVGTITNRGDEPLKHLMVRTRFGWAMPRAAGGNTAVARIEPGQTLQVNAPLEPADFSAQSRDPDDWRRNRNPYYPYQVAAIDKSRLWDQGGDLSMRRTDRIEQWLAERDDLACVYAECESPAPAADLETQPASESHWKVVRALVPLGR